MFTFYPNSPQGRKRRPGDTAKPPRLCPIPATAGRQLVHRSPRERETAMKSQPSTLGFFGQAIKLPFNIFADEEDRVLTRLEELHKSLPDQLPEKRFFKH